MLLCGWCLGQWGFVVGNSSVWGLYVVYQGYYCSYCVVEIGELVLICQVLILLVSQIYSIVFVLVIFFLQ